MQEEKRKRALSILEWYEALIFGLAAVVICFSFVFRVILVSGSSMYPTLEGGDRLLVWALNYKPERGDIIILDGYIDYGKPLVKRIIAVEGDTIDINFNTGDVFVNGQLLDEPYIAEPTVYQADVEFPLTVGEGKIFVMGDNRNSSTDSRDSDVGCLDERDVLGKAIIRLTPFEKMGKIE